MTTSPLHRMVVALSEAEYNGKSILHLPRRRGLHVGEIDALAEAAMQAYGRHQTGEADGLPPHEPATCGTQHLIAERALRIITSSLAASASSASNPLDGSAIQHIIELCDEAGVAFAREDLKRHINGFYPDEVPF